MPASSKRLTSRREANPPPWGGSPPTHKRPPGPSWGRGRALNDDQRRQLPTAQQQVRALIDSAAAGHGRRWSVVAVQDLVQAAPDRVVRAGLDGTGDRVAAEEDVGGTGELAGLDDLAVGH